MLDEVILVGIAAGNSLAAPMLAAVGVERQALDVAVVADGDRVGFLGDQVFVADPADRLDDLGFALVAVLVAQLDQVGADGRQDVALGA